MKASYLYKTGLRCFALILIVITFSGCKLIYSAEEFTLSISPDGIGKLVVRYDNFGSAYMESHKRKKDLAKLQSIPRDPRYKKDAEKVGVDLKVRRLELVNYALNGYVEASANRYNKLFKYFTYYKLEEEAGMIYITPLNGTVLQATHNEGGKIVERGGKVAFSWPAGTPVMSFKATYATGGASFQYDLQKKYKAK